MGGPHKSRKFDSQTVDTSNDPSCRTKPYRSRQIKWMQMILMQTFKIISGPTLTAHKKRKSGIYKQNA